METSRKNAKIKCIVSWYWYFWFKFRMPGFLLFENFLSSIRISIFSCPGYRTISPHTGASPAGVTFRGLLSHRFLRMSSWYFGFFHVHSTLSAVFLLWCLCEWIQNIKSYFLFFTTLKMSLHLPLAESIATEQSDDNLSFFPNDLAFFGCPKDLLFLNV